MIIVNKHDEVYTKIEVFYNFPNTRQNPEGSPANRPWRRHQARVFRKCLRKDVRMLTTIKSFHPLYLFFHISSLSPEIIWPCRGKWVTLHSPKQGNWKSNMSYGRKGHDDLGLHSVPSQSMSSCVPPSTEEYWWNNPCVLANDDILSRYFFAKALIIPALSADLFGGLGKMLYLCMRKRRVGKYRALL